MDRSSHAALTLRARSILGRYRGYPEIPNGLPSGVWAYMIANAARPVLFAQRSGAQKSGDDGPEGEVRRLAEGESARANERVRRVWLPTFDPSSSKVPRLWYAAIHTDPTGVEIATFPKGTQDLIAQRPGSMLRIELGQRTSLLRHLAEFGVAADERADLNRLHESLVATLLGRDYEVEIEDTFTTAVRETREEHGFDLDSERARVRRVDAFVERALSKRRPSRPIRHHLYCAWVSDFESTLPRTSVIREEKHPLFEGRQYREAGTFSTLTHLRNRAHEAHQWLESRIGRMPSAIVDAVKSELAATVSRLSLLARIERSLVARLHADGLWVGSDLQPGPAAAPVAH